MGIKLKTDYSKADQYKYLINRLKEKTAEYEKCCSLLHRSFFECCEEKKRIDIDVIYRQAENALLLVDNARRQLADWLLENSDYVIVGVVPPS